MKKLWKPALLLVALAIMAFGMLSSGAWFTDSATSNTAALHSGTLSIEDAELKTVSLGSISNMAPGDKTDEMVVIIKNNGNIDLAWFGDLVVTGDAMMKDAIYIDYAQMEFLTPTSQNWQVDGTDNFILDGVGSGLSGAWYDTLAAASPFGQLALSKFDGSSGMGVAPYEFNGALKPGYSYKLTLKFGFSEDANNDYMNKGPLNISFAVKAAQIKEGAIASENPGSWAVTELVTWLNNQIADQTEN